VIIITVIIITGIMTMAQNWIMMISELHRYQGVSYKSDIIVISGLDPGDRQALEMRYAGCDPPCLLDSSDGRFVLKGASYNPMDVANCLMIRRGYKMSGAPQQRSLPNVHNKDDKFAYIYHLSKDTPLRRTDTILSGLVAESGPSAPPLASANQSTASEPWTNQRPSMDEPDLTRQASDLKIKSTSFK